MSDHAAPDPSPLAPATPKSDGRACSLDALRGLAILLMCLSGLVPGALPNWMSHGYYPAELPTALLDADAEVSPGTDLSGWSAVEQKSFRGDWPGFTWVDWVFPMFLFAMGASIPLALHARRKRGDGFGALLRGVVVRFFLLVAFAVYAQHVTPYFMENPPGVATWWIALLAMVPVGLVLTRLPRGWAAWKVLVVRVAGWVGAAALIAWTHHRSGKAFSWNDKDIIILLLAWSSLLVSLATLVAGRRAWLRLVIVLPIALLAHHQGMKSGWRVFGDTFDGWMPYLQKPQAWLDLPAWGVALPRVPEGWLDFSGLYHFTWFKFAGIVVFGTIAGDVLLQRQTAPESMVNHRAAPARLKPRGFVWHVVLTVLLLTAIVGTLVGLKDYATTFAVLGGWRLSSPWAVILLGGVPALAAIVWFGRVDRLHPDQFYLLVLTMWGTAWLCVGIALALAPGPALGTAFGFFEGGIKKGPPSTLSWYVVSFGLSVLLLAALAAWLDVSGPGRRFFRATGGWLIANGQNPMLAYLGIRNLLAPLMALPLLAWFLDGDGPGSVNAWMLARVFDGGPWAAAAWAGVQTLGLALAVWALTRRRIVWRS